MLTQKNRITIRQVFIIFIIASFSPSIRLFPSDCAELAKQAAWIAPLISAIALLLLCMVLQSFFKNKNIANLSDAFTLSLGKIAGKIVLSCYLFWTVILYLIYIRYYVERLLSSIFPNTDMRFFIISMLIMVYIAAHGKIEAFARFAENSILIFMVVFILFFIMIIPNVKASNLLPVTYLDILPAAKATYPIVGIWGYITFLFFLGEYIINKDQIKNQSKKSILFLAVMNILMLVFVIGSIGYTVAQRMDLPFFNVVKLITIMETMDRFESILLAIWVIADFIIITLFAIIILNITKSLFGISQTKYLASPIVLLGYFGSQFLASNRFELELFSGTVGLSINIFFCFIIPVLVLAIGKLRKKI